jgi:hypothetical protein
MPFITILYLYNDGLNSQSVSKYSQARSTVSRKTFHEILRQVSVDLGGIFQSGFWDLCYMPCTPSVYITPCQ